MKGIFGKGLVLAVLVTFFQVAKAGDIRLGVPGYGGSGCPAGTASITLSPDQKTLSFIFDRYVAEAGASYGRTLDRKACNISVPVHIPQGFSVSLLQVDYRGFVSARGGESEFNVEYFFAGSRGPKFTKTFNNEEREYLLSNDLRMRGLSWSRCGEDVNVRVNSSVKARSFAGDDTIISVDSADIRAGIIYHLQWRRC
jgi:hypothetical protein